MFYTPSVLQMLAVALIQSTVFFGLAYFAGVTVALTAFIAFPLGMLTMTYLNGSK